jgi:hypothetical protein
MVSFNADRMAQSVDLIYAWLDLKASRILASISSFAVRVYLVGIHLGVHFFHHREILLVGLPFGLPLFPIGPLIGHLLFLLGQ